MRHFIIFGDGLIEVLARVDAAIEARRRSQPDSAAPERPEEEAA
jgi:hypothetical protein